MVSQARAASLVSRVISLIAAGVTACTLTVTIALAQNERESTNERTTTAESEVTNEPAPESAQPEEAEHAGTAGHEDPTDLGHGNAGPNLGTPADLRFDLAIYTFVVFLLLLAILYKFAWGPISKGLEKREAGIAQMIDEAKQAADSAAARLREYELKLAAATEETRVIIAQAHQDAQKASERLIADAQQKADRERTRALADIEAAKNVALESISQRSVSLALALAGKIMRKELRESDHTQLIRDALDKLPSRN